MNYLKAIEKLENEKQYLLYYKTNVINDLYHLTYPTIKSYETNIILMDIMNQQEFKRIKHIFKKYRIKAISNFGDINSIWYDKILDNILNDCLSYFYLVDYYDAFLYYYIDYIDFKIYKKKEK